MSGTIYTVGIDPQEKRPIVSTPIMSDRFVFAPKFFHADYVRGTMAAGQACFLETDSVGFDRLLSVVSEMST